MHEWFKTKLLCSTFIHKAVHTTTDKPLQQYILHGYITNSQYDQLPVGLIAQLVEHCTGIAEVMDSNPVQAWIFFQAFFSQLLKLRSNCEDLSSIWSFIRSSNICFIYLHSFIHPSRVYYERTIWPAPSWLDSSVGRALHRHCRGHGFESHSSLNFFQAFFSQLLKLHSNCEDLSSIWPSNSVCMFDLPVKAGCRCMRKFSKRCYVYTVGSYMAHYI